MGPDGLTAMLLWLADWTGPLVVEVLLDPSGSWSRCGSGLDGDICKVDVVHLSSIDGGQDFSGVFDGHARSITQVGVCCNCGTERAV